MDNYVYFSSHKPITENSRHDNFCTPCIGNSFQELGFQGVMTRREKTWPDPNVMFDQDGNNFYRINKAELKTFRLSTSETEIYDQLLALHQQGMLKPSLSSYLNNAEAGTLEENLSGIASVMQKDIDNVEDANSKMAYLCERVGPKFFEAYDAVEVNDTTIISADAAAKFAVPEKALWHELAEKHKGSSVEVPEEILAKIRRGTGVAFSPADAAAVKEWYQSTLKDPEEEVTIYRGIHIPNGSSLMKGFEKDFGANLNDVINGSEFTYNDNLPRSWTHSPAVASSFGEPRMNGTAVVLSVKVKRKDLVADYAPIIMQDFNEGKFSHATAGEVKGSRTVRPAELEAVMVAKDAKVSIARITPSKEHKRELSSAGIQPDNIKDPSFDLKKPELEGVTFEREQQNSKQAKAAHAISQ